MIFDITSSVQAPQINIFDLLIRFGSDEYRETNTFIYIRVKLTHDDNASKHEICLVSDNPTSNIFRNNQKY